MRRSRHPLSIVLAIVVVFAGITLGVAQAPANEHFQRTWARTDQPVANGTVARTWIWGPTGNTGAINESYADALNGVRVVQYFDKSRMEINNPAGDPASAFYVTNGLLVVELMTGQMQMGHTQFSAYSPATANVAGDQGDPNSPTYAGLALLRSAPAVADGSVITQRINANGSVTSDPALAGQNVTAAFRLTAPGIDHQVASPFWEFLNSSGPVIVNGQAVNQRLFNPWFYATGYPITEAYWADVKVAGTTRLVLMQCFERRCLTYTPGNPAGFLTEAGNVGQHYYSWRYQQGPVVPPPPPPPQPTTKYEFDIRWGGELSTVFLLKAPTGLAIDAGNNVWVADAMSPHVAQFDRHGRYLNGVVLPSLGPSDATSPWHAAFSPDGRMYVVDSGNSRIQVFDAQGAPLPSFGTAGSGNGQFKAPSAVAVHDGSVYVLDTYNHRVQVFNLDGVYQRQFGTQGAGDGQLASPLGMVIDAQGNVHVTDTDNSRVQKFSSQGAYLGQFGSFGEGNGEFDTPWGIGIGPDGSIFVSDTVNHRVQKFDSTGAYLSKWGTQGTGYGQFTYPEGLAVDQDGNVYVAEGTASRVQKFTGNGAFLFNVRDNQRGYFHIPEEITTDLKDNLLVVDFGSDGPRVSRYTGAGIPLDGHQLVGNGIDADHRATAVAVGPTGNVYIAFASANRVLRYGPLWTYLGDLGEPGSGPGQFSLPTGIAFDEDGNIYVADAGNSRIQKFNANGAYQSQWGSNGSGPGQFSKLESIAIDGDRVYAADFGNVRVQVFDRSGAFQGQWTEGTPIEGELFQPIGLAINPYGYIVVADYANGRVEVFTPEGEAVGSFGSAGALPGQLLQPLDVTVDAAGNAYVTDYGSSRVSKFVPLP